MYYLQSRYYNPEWGRFISADAIAGSVGELLSHNVFAYCKNNPVNMRDPSGFRPVAFEGDFGGDFKPISYEPIIISANAGGTDKVVGDIVKDSVKTSPNEVFQSMPGNRNVRRNYIRNISKGLRNEEFIPSNFKGKFALYSSTAGLLNTVLLALSMSDNYNNYGYQNGLLASAIDVTFVVIGVAMVAAIPAAAPALIAVCGAMIAGAAATYGANTVKDLVFKKQY